MELNIYDIIKRPIISDKSLRLFDKLGKVTFKVNKLANKIMIRQAVEKIWDVKVDNVRIVNSPGKSRTFGGKTAETQGFKKAIVTLKKGYKIDLPGYFESMGASGSKESEVKNTITEG